MSAATTRRGILGMFAAAPAVALAGSAAVARSTSTDAGRFLFAMEAIHPNARRAAELALAAGIRPDQLSTIIVEAGDKKKPERWPALIFNTAPDPSGYNGRTFRSCGEDA